MLLIYYNLSLSPPIISSVAPHSLVLSHFSVSPSLHYHLSTHHNSIENISVISAKVEYVLLIILLNISVLYRFGLFVQT